MDENEIRRRELNETASQIKEDLPIERKRVFENLMIKYPDLDIKNFSDLSSKYRFNKLPSNIHKIIKPEMERLNSLKEEEKICREESFKLHELIEANDKRKSLDPKIDIIPSGSHQKLSDCKEYPLRNSCNHGEDETSKWERCEHMKYDNNESILGDKRWICTAV